VKRGLILVAANRPFDVLDGPLIVAPLGSQDSEEVKCVGLPRVGLDDLPVDLLRLLQPAGAVILYSRPQGLVSHDHEHRYGDATGRSTNRARHPLVGREAFRRPASPPAHTTPGPVHLATACLVFLGSDGKGRGGEGAAGEPRARDVRQSCRRARSSACRAPPRPLSSSGDRRGTVWQENAAPAE
jgi:hypothetical protein